MSWKAESIEVIRRVIEENPGLDGPALRKKVSEAYPFGVRRHYPYKAWQEAVNALLGPSERKRDAERKKLDAFLEKIGQKRLDEA